MVSARPSTAKTRHSLHACLPLSVEGRWCRPRPRFQLARYQPVTSGTGAGSGPATATRPHCPVSPRHSAVALRIHGQLSEAQDPARARYDRRRPTDLVLRSHSAVMIRAAIGYHASGRLQSVNGWISIWFTSRRSLSPANDQALWGGQAVPCERRECLPVGTGPIVSHRQEWSGQLRFPYEPGAPRRGLPRARQAGYPLGRVRGAARSAELDRGRRGCRTSEWPSSRARARASGPGSRRASPRPASRCR